MKTICQMLTRQYASPFGVPCGKVPKGDPPGQTLAFGEQSIGDYAVAKVYSAALGIGKSSSYPFKATPNIICWPQIVGTNGLTHELRVFKGDGLGGRVVFENFSKWVCKR